MSIKLPFEYDAKSVDGYVVVPCPDRDYGVLRVFVPTDFWPEGRFLLARIWGKKNPGLHSDGTFTEIAGVQAFNLSPLTVNTGGIISVLRTITAPVYAASRSIKCLVEWPEMSEWKRKYQTGAGPGGNKSPLEEESPIRYVLDVIQSKEIKLIPFGNGRMVPHSSAELDYLANAS